MAHSQIDEMVERFGEEHRQTIANCIRFLDHAEPKWKLPKLVNRPEYVSAVLGGFVTNREMVYRVQLYHVYKWAYRQDDHVRRSLEKLCLSLPGTCICGSHMDQVANCGLTRNYQAKTPNKG